MANKTPKFVAFGTRPKRQIEKSVSYISDVFTAAGGTAKVLHTTTDRETLVRMVVQLVAKHELSSSDNLTLCIQRRPTSISTWDIDSIEALDQSPPQDQIWNHRIRSEIINESFTIDVDLKAMRKLSKDDLLVLWGVTDTSVAFLVDGVVTCFFKQG